MAAGSNIELSNGRLRCVQLPTALGEGPLPRCSVYRDRRPALPVFVRDVDKQCVPVVFYADAMQRIAFLFETAHCSAANGTSDK